MVETGGSSWHQTNRGVSIYFTVYATLFFIVVILSKLLHDRPTLASFVPEAAMIILVGMFAGLIFYLLMGDENDANDAVESMLSFSPTVFFVVLVSYFIKPYQISTLQKLLSKLIDVACCKCQNVAPAHHF
jgi:uncharacterized membrane protein